MHLHFNSSVLDYIHLAPPSWSITATTMKVCAVLFSLLDFEKTNQLELYQIRAVLTYLTDMPKKQIATLFYTLDLDQSAAMELEEFFLLITLLVANKDKKEKEFMHAHSKTVFELLDEDSSGSVTLDEFQRLGFLFNLQNREIRFIFKDFDISGDDALDYGEFRMFTLACINKQKSKKKKRLKVLLERRFRFLAEQRRPVLHQINRTIHDCAPDLVVYDEDGPLPRVPFLAEMSLHCERSDSSPKNSTDEGADELEHIHVPSINETQSTRSQAVSQSYSTTSNIVWR